MTEIGISELFKGENMPEKLPELLELLRLPLQKLSESNIEKSVYNQWRRAGIIDALKIKSEEKKWNKFSIMDLVVLKIVNVLWRRNISDEQIKSVVNQLLSEGIKFFESTDPLTGINRIGSYYESSDYLMKVDEKDFTLSDSLIKLGGKNLDFIWYITTQKKLNPHLPLVSWIESFIIGCLRTSRPYSILLFDNGEIKFFFTDILSDQFYTSRNNQLFKLSFINISVNNIISDLLSIGSDLTKNRNTTTSENSIILKLLEKGYDVNTISEVLERNNKITFIEESLPVNTKIEKAINEYANQDLLVKVRDSKKTSIKRLIINKK